MTFGSRTPAALTDLTEADICPDLPSGALTCCVSNTLKMIKAIF